jgi:hypothetical protein
MGTQFTMHCLLEIASVKAGVTMRCSMDMEEERLSSIARRGFTTWWLLNFEYIRMLTVALSVLL